MKANCLTRALDLWKDNPDYRLWYNHNHVIALEGVYEASDITLMRSPGLSEYLPLKDFGLEYFNKSFKLSFKYVNLLNEYLKTE